MIDINKIKTQAAIQTAEAPASTEQKDQNGLRDEGIGEQIITVSSEQVEDNIGGSEELWRDWVAALEPAHAPIKLEPKSESEEDRSDQAAPEASIRPTPPQTAPQKAVVEGHTWIKYLPWIAAGILALGGAFLFAKNLLGRRHVDHPKKAQEERLVATPPPEDPKPKGFVVP